MNPLWLSHKSYSRKIDYTERYSVYWLVSFEIDLLAYNNAEEGTHEFRGDFVSFELAA